MSSKFESGVKQIPYTQQQVYAKLSNLENVEKVKDRVPQEYIKDMMCDRDSVSVNIPPVGMVTLVVVEREEPKCIKFGGKDTPVDFNLWIKLLPVTDETCKMKVTLKADIPLFLRPMVGSKLEGVADQIADVLATLPYE